jgi:hypothetical protein
MANNIGPDLFSPALWSARIQYLLKRNLVGAAIANTEERPALAMNGYRIHRPYMGDVYAQTYTKGTAPTFQDMTATDEYLDVDQFKIIAMYIDDIDKIQNKYDTLNKYSERAAYQMKSQMDQKILSNVQYAALGNSTAVSLDTTNVFKYVSEAKAALHNNAVEDTAPWYMVADPATISTIEQTFAFNGFKVSDDALVNGYGAGAYLGDWQGLQMFRSQNLPVTLPITFSDDPTTTHTLIINGVTFTFIAALSGVAGQVLIDAGSDVDVTIGTNLVAAINGTAVGTIYVQLSAADRAKLAASGLVASYAAGSNILTLTSYGQIVIGAASTQTTGVVGTQAMLLPIGKLGGIDLVIQKDVETEILRVTDGRKGSNVTVFDMFGTKMFVEGAQRTYALKIVK